MALARLVFVTWIIGFQLIIVGIQVSTVSDTEGQTPGGGLQ
jgi:hypothetical protein